MGNKHKDYKYFTHVKPRFVEIEELVKTLSQEQVARYIGISKTMWFEYRKRHQEFDDLIFKSQVMAINNLKNKLHERANGFQYPESVTIEEDGIIKKKTYQRTALPDVAAINLLLKNMDRKNWSNDPQMLEIKKEELKIKRENQW